MIDVGVETYTAKTFSSKRYEIWTMQSAFHNLPTINGVMQAAGRQYRSARRELSRGRRGCGIRRRPGGGLPKEAGVEKWRRNCG